MARLTRGRAALAAAAVAVGLVVAIVAWALRPDPPWGLTAEGGAVAVPVTTPGPWRAAVVPDPWRLTLELDPPGEGGPGWDGATHATALPGPMEIATATLSTGPEGAAVHVTLAPADAPPAPPTPAPEGQTPLTVALDPGHGGVDPGAEAGGVVEAKLMTTFAAELSARLRAGGARVVLTHEHGAGMPLRARPSAARAAGADVLISLHADAVATGEASGATVYTLGGAAAGGALAAELTARQAPDDLIGGLDLSATGDDVARALVDLARRDTDARSAALSAMLARGIGAAGLRLHKRPEQRAAFTVLKAPDIPAVLLELGFMSDPGDLANLTDPAWRGRMADAVAGAVLDWAAWDAVQAPRRRR